MTLTGRRNCFLFLLIACLFLIVASCQTEDDDDKQAEQETPEEPEAPDDLPNFLSDRPELLDWSSWSSHFDHQAPIPWHRIGGFGIGNGRVFAMLASVPPFSTIRNMNGPTYQKHLRYYSDKEFTLFNNGQTIHWDIESTYRVRDTAVYVTRQQRSDLSLWIVDLVPRGALLDGLLATKSFVRLLIVKNDGDQPLNDLVLSATTMLGKVKGLHLGETITDDNRQLLGGFVDNDRVVANQDNGLSISLDQLAPGQEQVLRFQFAFARAADPLPIFDTVAELESDFLIAETISSWKEFTAKGAKITTDDIRFNDLIEGLAVTMSNQQAIGGCFAQMSEYGYNALRDLYGLSRFYPLVGRSEDYRRMLDYVWRAMLEEGDIRADVTIDLDFPEQQPEPDWENLGILKGRAGAETPSYLILHYQEYVEATGDWQPAIERYGMLRHAMIHQDVRNDCLLPFSDDETFRPAMMIAFGHDVLDGYIDKYLSANSSFLFVVAANFMQRLALQMDNFDHADQYAELAQRFRECTEQYYWMEGEGYYAPIIDIDTLESIAQPYEEVNTQPLYMSYLSPDDPHAENNLLAMMALLNQEGGFFYSPLHENYQSLAAMLGFEKGVITGMAYGYQLENFARIDHPWAEESFMMFNRFFHDTGNVSEGQVVDDFGRMAYFYDASGFVVDLTARYRSWEGAINAAAMINYLFGLELDAPRMKASIAPNLPSGWPMARMEKIRLADQTFDLLVEDDGVIRRVSVSNATALIAMDAIISVAGEVKSVTVNNETVEPEIILKWERSRVLLPELTVDADQPLVVEVTRSGN